MLDGSLSPCASYEDEDGLKNYSRGDTEAYTICGTYDARAVSNATS